MQIAPRRVGSHVAGEARERGDLDAMRDSDRFTGARQQHEEAPRAHAMDSQHARRRGVDAAEVVEQPAIGADFAEQIAQRGKIKTVEDGHRCRGSGLSARHSQRAPPRARQATCSIAPS